MTHSARFVTTPEFSPLTPSPLHRESVTPALLRSETYDEPAGAGGDDPDTLGCGPRPARPAAPLSPRPAARGAERTVPVTAPGARGPGTPQRPGTGSSEPRRCRPSPAAGLGSTAAPRAPRTPPPPAGPRGTHRPGPRLPSRLPRCAAHGSAQTRRRPGTDEAGGGPAPRARGGADRRGGAGRAPGLAADGAGPRSAGGCPFPAAVSINGELGAVQPMAARRNVIP